MSDTRDIIDFIEKLLKAFELNPKLYGTTTEIEKMENNQIKEYLETFGNQPHAIITMPAPVYTDAARAFMSQGLKASKHPKLVEGNFVQIMVPDSQLAQYKALIPDAIVKQCSPQSKEVIVNELHSKGVKVAYQGKDDLELVFNKKDKDLVRDTFLKYDGMNHKMDTLVANVVMGRLKAKNIDFNIEAERTADGKTELRYLATDKKIIDDIIKEVENTRYFSETDFKNRFCKNDTNSCQCASIPLKDDIELNKFMDLAVQYKFDYMVQGKNIVFPEYQKEEALKCKDEMLHELYSPINLDKYNQGKFDAIMQTEALKSINNKTGSTRYFVSVQHPDMFLVVHPDNSMEIKQRADEYHDGTSIISAQNAELPKGASQATISGFLNRLGTPVEVSESKFAETKLSKSEVHAYKEDIETAREKHLGKIASIEDAELKRMKEVYKAKEDFYTDHPEEFINAIKDDVEISEETKKQVVEITDIYVSRTTTLIEDITTIEVNQTLDDIISTHTEQGAIDKTDIQQEVNKNFSNPPR